MKFIIDIPNKYIDYNKSILQILESCKECKVTILPKGHGRIVDESKITSCYWGGETKQMSCNAPTIIQADKENDESSN